MQLKICAVIFMAILLLACKPSAQAAAQPSSDPTPPASETEDDRTTDAPMKTPLSDEAKHWRKGMPEGITEIYYDCLIGANYTPTGMASCIKDEERRQDTRLNKSYKKLQSILNHEQRRSLTEAQRSWLAWRSKEEELDIALSADEPAENSRLEMIELARLASRADVMEGHIDIAEVNASYFDKKSQDN